MLVHDLDGDGKGEILHCGGGVVSAKRADDTLVWSTRISGAVRWSQPVGEMGTTAYLRLADMNADGRVDVVRAERGGCAGSEPQTGFIYSFQGGFALPTRVVLGEELVCVASESPSPLWSFGAAAGDCGLQSSGFALADWNGDGIDDVLQVMPNVRADSGKDGSPISKSTSHPCYFLPTPIDTNAAIFALAVAARRGRRRSWLQRSPAGGTSVLMADPQSKALFERACALIPGGVNSPVRAFRAVGGEPVFIARAKGARLHDVSGGEYVDFVGSWGPAILGHAHPDVVRAVQEAAERGLSFGAPTAGEVTFAEAVRSLYPSIHKMRCVSSGTEATMSAIRAARGFTGRDYIVKFEGCYHGHADHLLVKAGSGLATFGVPDSAGVPEGTARTTLTLPYNDIAALEALFAARGAEIAAAIVEPVVGNMGCVPPAPGFLAAILSVCKKHGAVSIFDEVMTGSRLARGGAQELYGLVPDMTALGKIIGGGMPLAAYGGREEIMNCIAPLGPVYQAGTLSGNPVAVAAGLATIAHLKPELYARLESLGAALEEGLREGARAAGVPATVQRVGSMITLFFREGAVRSWDDAVTSDTLRFGTWHAGMISRGIYWPPSQFEAAFLSGAHTEADIERAVKASREVLTA